jgi:hypothetical protein
LTEHSFFSQIFIGNWDANTIARGFLFPPIVARFIRLHPKEHVHFRALRVEFVGCYSGDEGTATEAYFNYVIKQ